MIKDGGITAMYSSHIMDADILMQSNANALSKIAKYSLENKADFEALVKNSLAKWKTDETKKQQKQLLQQHNAKERDGEIHDYTRKGGVIHTEILLPDNAPTEYADRSIVWNAARKIENAKNSQLARDIEISLPIELTREQNLSLAREYVKRHFVAEEMCADLCLHDTGGGNPHAHIMLTMRHFEQGGKKTLSESDQILFTAAHTYLKAVMNGHPSLPVKAWKTVYAKLTAEHRTLNGRYLSLKDKVKEAEQIRGSVYSILRQTHREQQPRKAQDMDL